MTADEARKICKEVYENIDISNEIKELDVLIRKNAKLGKRSLEFGKESDLYRSEKLKKIIDHYCQNGFKCELNSFVFRISWYEGI